MKICRFNDNRLGLVEGDDILDVTAALEVLPAVRWPAPLGDLLVANLDKVKAEAQKLAKTAKRVPLKGAKLLSPVANPTKVIGAPVNYRAHQAESQADAGINYGRETRQVNEAGLFLKASSGLVGPSEGCAIRFTERRNDHEVELAVIIGKPCERTTEERALDYVAGYAIGLDMTLRGPEDRSIRKSIDSYSVLGPWLVTADEIPDPDNLDFSITVSGQKRQKSNTRLMIYGVRKLISWATEYYRLYPGDIIMTGTPEGVGPVKAGDVMHCEFDRVGVMDVAVRAH